MQGVRSKHYTRCYVSSQPGGNYVEEHVKVALDAIAAPVTRRVVSAGMLVMWGVRTVRRVLSTKRFVVVPRTGVGGDAEHKDH